MEQKFEIDRLKQENGELKASIEAGEERKKTYNKAQEEKKLQDLAKMLGSMQPEVLGPILDNLPDRLIQIFYDKAKSKDRAKIFNAMTPERAGKILTDMTRN